MTGADFWLGSRVKSRPVEKILRDVAGAVKIMDFKQKSLLRASQTPQVALKALLSGLTGDFWPLVQPPQRVSRSPEKNPGYLNKFSKGASDYIFDIKSH